LTTLGPNTFAGMTSLKNLDLFINQIGSISDRAFQGLTSLQNLSVAVRGKEENADLGKRFPFYTYHHSLQVLVQQPLNGNRAKHLCGPD
jgi:hypothetical protein